MDPDVHDYGTMTQKQILSNAEGVPLDVHARRMRALGDTEAKRALSRGQAELVKVDCRKAFLYYKTAIEALLGAIRKLESTDD